jgi:AcrR family transcriptional regulator
MSSVTADKPKAAQRIQSAAKDLFHRQGIRATGIEEVCRVAEATKMSLYRSYPSKDALVAAILEEDAAAYEAWFAEATGRAESPSEKLCAVILAVADKLERPEYCGCPLLLAQAEFRDPDHPTHQFVAVHKTRMRQQLAGLAREAGAEDPTLLGDTLAMLVDGAWSSLPYMGSAQAASVLRRSAAMILEQTLSGKGR